MNADKFTEEELEMLLEALWKSGKRTDEARELYHKIQQAIVDVFQYDRREDGDTF